jgi:CxxC motif-containing protein (DUF1111 family)
MMRRSTATIALLALFLAGPVVSGNRSGIADIRLDLSARDRARVAAVTAPTTDFSKPEHFEALQAGATTSIEEPDRLAFSHFTANLETGDEMRFRLGNALFRQFWVASPSSTLATDGLGPFYNARSCESCHSSDGRGHTPDGAADATSMLLRLARPPASDAEKQALAAHLALNFADPVYGRQLQDKAVPGLAAEGRMAIAYADAPFAFPDGRIVVLRKPTYTVTDLRYGPLGADTSLSARLTPAMIGLGLIEAISDDDLRANADPDDRDHDGISGLLQQVNEGNGGTVIGRFGWKAENASIRGQTAHAFLNDIGLSSPDLPLPDGDCTAAETDCHGRPNGEQKRLGRGEATEPVMSLVTFYAENLAVPARRKTGAAETLAGKKLFYGTGCIACHRAKYVTRRDWPQKSLSFQLIWPYSDFLLHDMGEGLADGQAVGVADGKEWRTPPLWGIGLTKDVSGHQSYLHDGRARTLEEAILWHGGEATAARDAYAHLAEQDRRRLIAFLESL